MGIEGNEIVDERTRPVALNDAVFERSPPLVDFQDFARSVLLREWQRKLVAADTGRCAHT
jgi:hypothetical protein